MSASDERLIDLYLDMLAAERGAAANTLEAYRRDLERFLRPSRRAGRRDRDGAGSEEIRRYLGDLSGRGFSAASVARRLSAIRQLYRFLYAEGNRKDDPAAAIEGPKRGRPLPKVLSIGHVDQLLAAAREGMDAARPVAERLRAARLNCLLEVLYATGLRVSELVALPASAARRDERMLIVRGKGNKERLVPLNESAKQAMRDYLALREEAAKPKKGAIKASKWLFPSFGESGHLTRQHFARDLKALAVDRRAEAEAGQPARAAPRLREPPAAERRRSALGADAARPRRHLHHADLHPCAGGAAEEPGARPASAGGVVDRPLIYQWLP